MLFIQTKSLYIIFLSFLFWIFTSCNSTGYEIEEVENNSDSSLFTSQNEIKQEIVQPNIEIKNDPVEIKNPDITINKNETGLYTVQLGAFIDEANALAFSNKVKIVLNINVSSSLINGLFKVRTAEFTNKKDASILLDKIKASGFDGFITNPEK